LEVCGKICFIIFKNFFDANTSREFLQNPSNFKENEKKSFSVKWFKKDDDKDYPENFKIRINKCIQKYNENYINNFNNLSINNYPPQYPNPINNFNNFYNQSQIQNWNTNNHININSINHNNKLNHNHNNGLNNNYTPIPNINKNFNSINQQGNNLLIPDQKIAFSNNNINNINNNNLVNNNTNNNNSVNNLQKGKKSQTNNLTYNNYNYTNNSNTNSNTNNNNNMNLNMNMNINSSNNNNMTNNNYSFNNTSVNRKNSINSNNNSEEIKNSGKYTCRFELQIENDKEFQVARRLIGAKVNKIKLSK
jgi:hypothetical protein